MTVLRRACVVLRRACDSHLADHFGPRASVLRRAHGVLRRARDAAMAALQLLFQCVFGSLLEFWGYYNSSFGGVLMGSSGCLVGVKIGGCLSREIFFSFCTYRIFEDLQKMDSWQGQKRT